MTAPTVEQQTGTVHRVALARDYYEKLFSSKPEVYIRGGRWRLDGQNGLELTNVREADDWIRVWPQTWGFWAVDLNVGLRRVDQTPFEFRLEAV
jgi:hypothetical protein